MGLLGELENDHLFDELLNTTRTMMTISKYLWELGSLVIATFGSMHLYYTFFSNKFSSRNEAMVEAMKTSSPILTKETTMWKAWIGFNASHSSGAIFIGLVNLYLAANYFEVLKSDHVFFIFNILTAGFYVWLAKKYWFRIPFTGIVITFSCYLIGYILVLLSN